eukprot:CAMPEP_0197529318 /NCGR_PEP_ID=MMETSP1318-20131121/28033_1 /TAXON_ID=552666 /ORGANISM="Partenskyella glossopodia, Strain RCC365" /LENGTH=136 /DNA_ID=CAMNT_0043084745 /DNA_START=328 /DNA_END=738 /DNA_ORIENTATION=-
MIPFLKEQGAKCGIKFSYGGKIGNTMNSHRLINFAKQHGKQDEVMEILMSYYFEQERDISDNKVLAEAASKAGLDAKVFLESNDGTDKVKEEVEDAYRKGISGVPAFIINKKHSLSGAQESETWEDVFKQLGYINK